MSFFSEIPKYLRKENTWRFYLYWGLLICKSRANLIFQVLPDYIWFLSTFAPNTNIPHNEGNDACRHYLNTCDQSTSTVRTETLCDLIKMILTMNSFEFNNTLYIQTHGTAMGIRMAPPYVNLFPAKFETDALWHAPHHPHIWWRFIDDMFVIWPEKTNYALLVLTSTTFTPLSNSLHPIQLATSTSFLDVKVSLDQSGKVDTDLYTKPTDKHQYLPHNRVTLYIRNEPFHSASLSDYDAYALPTKASDYALMNSVIKYLNDREYNLSFLKKEIQRVHSITRNKRNPVRLPQTNPVAFRLLSHTILPFAPYQVSFKNTLKSFRLPHDATNSFKRHLLLLSDEPTTFYSDIWVRSKLRTDRPVDRPTNSSRPTAVSDHFFPTIIHLTT